MTVYCNGKADHAEGREQERAVDREDEYISTASGTSGLDMGFNNDGGQIDVEAPLQKKPPTKCIISAENKGGVDGPGTSGDSASADTLGGDAESILTAAGCTSQPPTCPHFTNASDKEGCADVDTLGLRHGDAPERGCTAGDAASLVAAVLTAAGSTNRPNGASTAADPQAAAGSTTLPLRPRLPEGMLTSPPGAYSVSYRVRGFGARTSAPAVDVPDVEAAAGFDDMLARLGIHRAEAEAVSVDAEACVDAEVAHLANAKPIKMVQCFGRETESLNLKWFVLVLLLAIVAVITGATLNSKDEEATTPKDVQTGDMPLSNESFSPLSFSVIHLPSGSSSPEMSTILNVLLERLLRQNLIPLTFSSNCSIVAMSLVDEDHGIIRTFRRHPDVEEGDQGENKGYEWKSFGVNGEEAIDSGMLGFNEKSDGFGSWLDLSKDGQIMAISSPRSSRNKIASSGSVSLYRLLERNDNVGHDKWVEMGHGVNGTEPFGWTGVITSLSADGSTIAVSTPLGARLAGRARVHRFDEGKDAWEQVGNDILGNAPGSHLTYVSLSADGTIMAVGEVMHDSSDGNSTLRDAGRVSVYKRNERHNSDDEWVLMGTPIMGEEEGMQLGTLPRLSDDGRTLSFFGDVGGSRVYRYYAGIDDWKSISAHDDHFRSSKCLGISPDGSSVILCSVRNMTSACSVREFIPEHPTLSKDMMMLPGGTDEATSLPWKVIWSFEPDFLPLAFARVDGKQVCGIYHPKKETIPTTIAFASL